jgi:hypothetical protein
MRRGDKERGGRSDRGDRDRTEFRAAREEEVE